MSIKAPTELVTADDLLALPSGRFRYELIQGELKEMAPAGGEHGMIALDLATALNQHAKKQGLGRTFAAETGFLIATDPDTVRAPDAAFVCRARVEEAGRVKGYWPGAPDLAVEVISPNDLYTDVEDKVTEWLEAGARMVVVVNPHQRTVTVYRSRSDIAVLTETDALDGGDVVPGWSVPVRDVFA